MAVNLSIKDVPDELADKLRQRAARNHRSLQGELMAIVEQATLGQPEAAPAAAAGRSWTQGWKTIEQLMAEREAAGWQPDPSLARAPLGVDIIRADRDSR
ncbi:Arc domain-containing protein [Rubrivivax sp. A210]|uniref:FitA-like ribbon-helix-helix domain-containing protein n=1 Tax=Rubrivivax sp. A210 TaxID=2772301 RepID=UPI00191896D8|nr:Arc family DNA-binding protein [Rubrivivax sp. A210]CAD5374205.1 Arc domain-containing protein [Rubrivivax sp. A210]